MHCAQSEPGKESHLRMMKIKVINKLFDSNQFLTIEEQVTVFAKT